MPLMPLDTSSAPGATLPPHPCLSVLLRLSPSHIIDDPSSPPPNPLLSFIDSATGKSLRVGDEFEYSNGIKQASAQPVLTQTQIREREEEGKEDNFLSDQDHFPEQDLPDLDQDGASASDDDDESETQSIADPEDLLPSRASAASLTRQLSVTRRSPVTKGGWVSKKTTKTSAFDDLTMQSIARPNKKKKGGAAAATLSRPSFRSHRRFGKTSLRSDLDSGEERRGAKQ